jgi:hypothetical protein
MKRIIVVCALVACPVLASAQEGGEASAAAGDVDFNYDDGAGSVTIVDYNRGSQSIAKAARDGKAITIKGREGRRRGHLGKVPEYHRVTEGDTLWALSQHYFANPWSWPRVWSYNPEITNPNWIYPGDRIRLMPASSAPTPAAPTQGNKTFAWARGQRPGTLFLRSRAFIDREAMEATGIIVGSREEVQLLAEHDEVYVEFAEAEQAQVGQEQTVFRVRSDVSGVPGGRQDLGSMVEILGAVRVISYDNESKIARAVVTESVLPIERGDRVSPMTRRFEVTPPVENQVDIDGHVVGAVEEVNLLAQHFLAFVDRGQEDGLLEGNRLFVRRQRDELRASNNEPDDRSGYPYEIIAELRVVEVRPRTATCLVTRSIATVQAGDSFEVRRGY